MGVLLIFLVIFLLFLNSEIFDAREGFSEESYPVGDGNHFNSNSRSNDYYYDRTGLKGSMYNILEPTATYKVSKDIEPPILNTNQLIDTLGLYRGSPNNCFTPMPSITDFKQTKYKKNIYEFDNFRKGVIL
jgi:hypothetical protein